MFMPYANNKGADQPVHPHSLIRTFDVCCLDTIISLVSISKISSLYLVSATEQTSSSLTWWQPLKTGFLVTGLIFQKYNVVNTTIKSSQENTDLINFVWSVYL